MKIPICVTITFVAVGICAIVGSCSNTHAPKPPKPSARTPAPSPTPLAIKVRSLRIGNRYVYLTKRRTDNTEAYILRSDANVAESAGEGTGRSDFSNPHIVFAERTGQRLVADAPHAVILVKEKNLLMDGGVRAHTSDGMTLQSDALTYDETTDRLHGVGNVLVTTPRGERLTGDVIDANVRLSEMRISHVRH
jgi:hypothetical protein